MLKGCAHDFLGRVDSTLEVGNRVARTYTECENVIDDRNRRSFGVFRGYGEWKFVPADSSHVFWFRRARIRRVTKRRIRMRSSLSARGGGHREIQWTSKTILTAANVRVGSGDRDGRLNREVFVD